MVRLMCRFFRSGRQVDAAQDRDPRAVFRAGLRFLQVGGLAFCLNLAITTTLHEVLGLPAELAFGIALVVLFFVTFFGFRRFVYQSSGRARRQIGRYFIAVVCFRMAEFAGFVALYKAIGVDYLVTAVIVLAISAIAKFLTFRHWVFTG